MTMPRRLVLSEGESVYHCISRCVRRAYLCGFDSLSGKNFDYRKDWVHNRLVFLTKVFSIEVLSYALMSSHSHSMLRTRPELMNELSDREVVCRWLKLYPKRGISPGGPQYIDLIDSIVTNSPRVAVLRKRLVSISWFMKSLNEYIARKANKEDDCKGRFWEGRFKCQKLCDQAAVLSCAVYIDLNPIRAKVSTTPEQSEFTSAYERIHAIKTNKIMDKEPDIWLAPVQDLRNRKGFLDVTIHEYLQILDETGKEQKYGKRGRIPPELEPILERVGIKPAQWIATSQSHRAWFSSAVGTSRSLRTLASSLGRSWLKGTRAAQRAFT